MRAIYWVGDMGARRGLASMHRIRGMVWGGGGEHEGARHVAAFARRHEGVFLALVCETCMRWRLVHDTREGA